MLGEMLRGCRGRKMTNPNILSLRYATETNEIFSEYEKTIYERELWIAVMIAQKHLGVNISSEDIQKYEKAINDVNLDLIKQIELRTRHDVKAKIQAFQQTANAGEHLHKGMTSRDLTDNVEQMQIKKSSELIRDRYISILRHFINRIENYENIIITARTHHQAAQPTTLGRRLAMNAEELYLHLKSFESFIKDYPLRGIKGPVGTQFDMLTLLGSEKKEKKLEKMVSDHLGFNEILDAPGQVYSRSLDYKLLSQLSFLAAGPQNFSKNMRLLCLGMI